MGKREQAITAIRKALLARGERKVHCLSDRHECYTRSYFAARKSDGSLIARPAKSDGLYWLVQTKTAALYVSVSPFVKDRRPVRPELRNALIEEGLGK